MENIANNYFLILAVFLGVTFFGFYLAYLYGRKTVKFHWSEYIGILITPTLFTIFLAYLYGEKVIELYFISSIFGFWLEYIIGFSYHKTLNKRLWIYQRYSIEGYTSYLTLPIWGYGGILFWLLGKSLG
ncbi:MAG: hypothetical protein WC831_01970 [Parcubacteria group bacterium]|jgi:hypothetical protein